MFFKLFLLQAEAEKEYQGQKNNDVEKIKNINLEQYVCCCFFEDLVEKFAKFTPEIHNMLLNTTFNLNFLLSWKHSTRPSLALG